MHGFRCNQKVDSQVGLEDWCEKARDGRTHERPKPQDVLPLWVADMDFLAPTPILDALRAAVEHGVFGYELPSRALYESVAARMKKLYNWDVSPESVVAIPGLVSGFFAAASTLWRPGDGYLIQPPVYMPFNDLQKQLGIIRQEAQLVAHMKGQRLHYEIDWSGFRSAFHAGGSRTRHGVGQAAGRYRHNDADDLFRIGSGGGRRER